MQGYKTEFDRVCGLSLIYNKNNKGPNTNPFGIPQIMVLASENAFFNETKTFMFVR